MPASSKPPQKTLLIVGAGASNEVGLPIGSDLKSSIVDALSYHRQGGGIRDEIIDRAIVSLANREPAQIHQYREACGHICDAMPQAKSIDNFIDQHSGDKRIELCGKLAIVRTILKAESLSKLFVDPSNIYNKVRFEDVEKTWFTGFWKLLTENCSVSDLEGRLASVAFVIFNYDRCIEHYLYHSLQNVYRIDAENAARLVGDIEIYHPYGTVGSLPWQSAANSVVYGGTPTVNQLLDLVSKIKTFTEGTDEKSSDVVAIRTHIRMAPRLVFLGFAFHKLNMKLLLPIPRGGREITQQRVFATARNMSFSDTNVVSGKLVDYCSIALANIHIGDSKCNELFDEYSQNLEFE
jgi:hypothetical protein